MGDASGSAVPIEPAGEVVWEIPCHGAMRVPARVFLSAAMLEELRGDACFAQLCNVACLPGIAGSALGMPDIHAGYGFPIGGVAAFDPAAGGVISPGGVGFDINCGVRLLVTHGIKAKKAREHRGELAAALLRAVPAGGGQGGEIRLRSEQLDHVGRGGAAWAVEQGFGTPDDLLHTEESGRAVWAEPKHVSADARLRGAQQLGTLGAGNHFLELQYVDEVHDEAAAEALGLALGAVTVLIHTGSRGFGHQVCDDFVARMASAAARYGVDVPDPQLCSVPFESDEGRAYFGAMGAAMNFAFANRQIITHRVRVVLADRFGPKAGAAVVYDVCHNVAKLEQQPDGRTLLVHRKGATRAFGPGHPLVPPAYRALGQPVLVPGDMGRYSYVLLGTAAAEHGTFGSCCHGAGRRLSRAQARAHAQGRDIRAELARSGISLQAAGRHTIPEELPEAYKDVAAVVDVVRRAGLARMVARLRPFAVVKG